MSIQYENSIKFDNMIVDALAECLRAYSTASKLTRVVYVADGWAGEGYYAFGGGVAKRGLFLSSKVSEDALAAAYAIVRAERAQTKSKRKR